jgi:hypothetical protein
VGKKDKLSVEVYGHPSGRFLVKSKFKKMGTSRSLEDLEWTLETFKFENPQVGVVGQNLVSYFKDGSFVNFFKDKKLISQMMNFLKEQENSQNSRNLTNLKLSMTTNLDENYSFLKMKSKSTLKQSEFIDDSFFCEKGDVPEKRYLAFYLLNWVNF